MTTPIERRAAALACGLALGLGALAAQAHDVTAMDAESISPGMSQAQVQRILGKPLEKHTYALGNGTTWRYEFAHRAIADESFDVDFAPDGTVKSAGEHMTIVEGD